MSIFKIANRLENSRLSRAIRKEVSKQLKASLWKQKRQLITTRRIE